MTAPVVLDDVLALHLLMVARRDRLLDVEVRRRIYEHVQDYPGLHLRELGRALGIDPNHAKYHLRALEKHGLVSSRRDEAYVRYYPRAEGSIGYQDTVGAQSKDLLGLLRKSVPLHVCLLLLDRGEATQGALRDEVGVAQSTLHYHLGKMEKLGVVVSRKDGRERHYRLADPVTVQQHLIRYRPPDALVRGFLDAWEHLELG